MEVCSSLPSPPLPDTSPFFKKSLLGTFSILMNQLFNLKVTKADTGKKIQIELRHTFNEGQLEVRSKQPFISIVYTIYFSRLSLV